MRTILLFCLLFVMNTAYAQKERTDETAIIQFVKNDAKDLKCDVYPGEVKTEDVQALMDKGRYVMSVTHTKFGTLIVHKKNTDPSKSQLFSKVRSWELKKVAAKKLKEGYAIDYYNKERGYLIYRKDPDVKKQTFLKDVNDKVVKKLNAKGMYVTLISYSSAYAQDGRKDVEEQSCVYYNKFSNFPEDFKGLSSKWVVGSVAKYYNSVGNYTSYKVIYDKPRNPIKTKEVLASFNTKEEFKSYVKKNLKDGRNINRIWCGWANYDYEAAEARAAAYNPNVFDILSGLTTSTATLLKGPGGDKSRGTSNADTGTGRSKGSKVKGSGRCKRCGGSGKCSPTSGTNRKGACHGSGLCGYCSGTGWIKAGGSEAACRACDGRGKCKTCKGTGKCPLCHGTGH